MSRGRKAPAKVTCAQALRYYATCAPNPWNVNASCQDTSGDDSEETAYSGRKTAVDVAPVVEHVPEARIRAHHETEDSDVTERWTWPDDLRPRHCAARIARAPTLEARGRVIAELEGRLSTAALEWAIDLSQQFIAEDIAALPSLASRRAALEQVPVAWLSSVRSHVARIYQVRKTRNR